MNHQRIILIFTLLSLTLCLSPAEATKLSGAPLPHRSDLQSSVNAQEINPPVSRYNRASQTSSSQDKQNNSNGSATNSQQGTNSQQSAKQEELAQAKAAKERQIQALAANNKAVQLGQAGKFEEAIAAHEEAIQLDPENKQFRINLSAAYCAYGQKLLAKNEFALAAHFFRRSIAAASDNALAGRCLIEALKKAGINPNSADDRLTLGDDLLSAGDIAGAGIEYQAAEQLEESARTFVKMGDYVYRLGQIDMAANWYRQATVKDPDCATAYRQLGFVALAKQDQSQAASLLRKAVILNSKDTAAGSTLVELWHKQVSLNPQIADNHLGLASALQLTGDLAAAELEYKKVVALDPHNPAIPSAQISLRAAYQHAEAQRHKAAADTLWGQDLKQEALAEVSQAVRLEPKNTEYQIALAQCLEATGDLQGARQAYLTCVLLDPQNNQQAAARLKAIQQSTNKAEQNPGNKNGENNATPNPLASAVTPAVTASAIASVAVATADTKLILDKIQALEQAHNYEQAINVLKELVSNNLENPEFHHKLAVDLMSTGALGEAISEFRIASALAPGQKTYASDLAQALAINKKAISQDDQSSDPTKAPQSNTTIGAGQ